MIRAVLDDLQLITGIDIPLEGIGLTLKQPQATEIAMLGEHQYFIALQLFNINKQQLHLEQDPISPWELFNKILDEKIVGVVNTRVLITNFLQLFIRSKILIGPNSLIVQTPEGLVNIEPEDFEDFQGIIGLLGGILILSPTEEEFHPKNRRAAEIAKKMRAARKRLKAIKAAQNGGKSEESGFLTTYIRGVALRTGHTLKEASEMTIMQLHFLMQTYLAWEAYDLEVKARLAGAEGKDELTHWLQKDPLKGDDNNNGLGTI